LEGFGVVQVGYEAADLAEGRSVLGGKTTNGSFLDRWLMILQDAVMAVEAGMQGVVLR
jgi:hypothetical protein